jgi:hypothetical protein
VQSAVVPLFNEPFLALGKSPPSWSAPKRGPKRKKAPVQRAEALGGGLREGVYGALFGSAADAGGWAGEEVAVLGAGAVA